MPDRLQLAIAGSGVLDAELRLLVTHLGLQNRVRFLGFETDVRRWLQAADGFVLSSRVEGLPMVLLEAAACELPAVATDVPGTREAIVDGETGWLAAADDAAALSAKMTILMQTEPEARNAMAKQARHFIVERFSLKAVLDQWESLYADLLDRYPQPKRWS
jgi:glycosyltransferase involved in cell wall biosynthesis